ncbi:MAG TPA: LURP-one-related family protein [Chloroflexia bacterium]|nr:LURP-one-related family protein [Chloroflexia bacterium]
MRYVIRERLVRLGEDSDITDEQGRPVYHVDGKVLTLHNTLIVRDLRGDEVAKVERQLIALRPTYRVSRPDAAGAAVRKQLISPFVDRFTIDVPGPHDLHVTGSLFEHEYAITRNGQQVAAVSKRWISLTETYGVDITSGEDDLLILASVLAIDLAADREHREHQEDQQRRRDE